MCAGACGAFRLLDVLNRITGNVRARLPAEAADDALARNRADRVKALPRMTGGLTLRLIAMKGAYSDSIVGTDHLMKPEALP